MTLLCCPQITLITFTPFLWLLKPFCCCSEKVMTEVWSDVTWWGSNRCHVRSRLYNQLNGRHVRLVANFFAIVKRFLHWNGKFHFHPFHHSLTAMSDQTTNVTITSSLSCLVLQKRCGNLFCLQIFCLEGGITLLSIVHFITKWLHKSGWASACNLGKSWQSFELVSPV